MYWNDAALICLGQVPECERCHDCFFQWVDVVSALMQNISNLRLQISSVLEENFNNTSVNDIEMEIELLLGDLEQGNMTLNSINIQLSSVDELQEAVYTVCTLYCNK